MADRTAPLDAELAALREATAGNIPLVELSLDEVRERLRLGHRLCSDGPVVTVTDLAPGDGRPVPVRVYEDGKAGGTLIYAHGGGWVTGDLAYADEFCRFLARDAGVRVVSVDYRLAPEHPFPSGLEDLAATWAWAAATYDGHVALGGDSAGGNLAAAVTHRAVSGDGFVPAYLLLLYPALGLPDSTPSYRTQAKAFPTGAADMRWFFTHYLGGEHPAPLSPDLAPLHAEDLSRMPRTHVVLAGHDPLHDEGAMYADALSAAGVAATVSDYACLCHGFLRFSAASAAVREARAEIVETVRRLAAGESLAHLTPESLPMIQHPPGRVPVNRRLQR